MCNPSAPAQMMIYIFNACNVMQLKFKPKNNNVYRGPLITSLVAINFSEIVVKFGTDTGEYGILKFVICFHFQVMPAFDNYVTYATYIHSDPLPYTMKLLGMW